MIGMTPNFRCGISIEKSLMFFGLLKHNKECVPYGWRKCVSLTGSTKCQAESQSRSLYFNEVQKKDWKKKVLHIFSVQMKTLHWNGSDTERLSCSNQYVLSFHSMGSSKEMLSMQSGWGLEAPVFDTLSQNNRRKALTRHCNRMTWKNKSRRRWGRGSKSNMGDFHDNEVFFKIN